MMRHMLPLTLLALCLFCVGAPDVARVMKAPETDTLLIFGEGFAAEDLEVRTGVTEVVWWPDQDADQIARIHESGLRLPQVEALPAQPTEDAKPCRIIRADGQCIVAASAGGYVLWVRGGGE